MKLRFFAVLLAAILAPMAMGCGGGGSSYQDRDVDPDVPAEAPGDPE